MYPSFEAGNIKTCPVLQSCSVFCWLVSYQEIGKITSPNQMKFGTYIRDTELQNGIENQLVTIQRSVCTICREATIVQK